MAVVLVGYFSFINGQRAVREVVNQLQTEIGMRVKDNLQDYLNIPHGINQTNANAIASGLLNLSELENWEKYLWRQVQTNNYIQGYFILLELWMSYR